MDGAGSYGAGLASFLQARGELVVEIGRPKRPARRPGDKSDALDALWTAREALACDHLVMPRRRGDREALRVLLATTRHSACRAKVSATNQLKALIVGAPEELRPSFAGLGPSSRSPLCPAAGAADPVAGAPLTVRALRSTAQRVQLLAAEAAGLQAELERLVAAIAPWLLELSGVGPISAALVLVSSGAAARLMPDGPAAPSTQDPPPATARTGDATRRRGPGDSSDEGPRVAQA